MRYRTPLAEPRWACFLARRIIADERELVQVGRQHQTIAGPVASDLLAHRQSRHVLMRGLDLDHAAFRSLTLARAPPLHLPGRVEAEVGMARALVGQLADAEHLGLSVAPTALSRFASGP